MYHPTSFAQHKDLPNLSDLIGQRGVPGTGLFPNDRFIKGVAKTIDKNFDLTQSAAGAPGAVTTLHEITIPAGALKIGDFFDIHYGGFYAANDNNKNLVIDFGIANTETTGLIDIDDLGWQFFIRYGIFSATVVRFVITLIGGLMQSDSALVFSGGFGGRHLTRGGSITVADINANSQLIRVRGQGTALGDVTKSVATVNLTRF